MTQELVLGALLSGLLGLLWVMALAMREEHGTTSEADSSSGNDDGDHCERALKHQTIAV